ncbi:pentatricopeptide repeat-containing protein At2g37320 isoform X2 [Hevea brasiliensis]|uniref:pentatricopeptide repeat-containing protein At2g37320 isoform X2 n=1 Tax=Hevea brasiliensis TaxID=3981 RepID=UPI0025F786DA|nr:pentatricopeptide repeat-containing protein At2g37320 isoform X2 [Hevea brasiliensis]
MFWTTAHRNKLTSSIHLIHTLSSHEPFSALKLTRTALTKPLDKALRILDIIAPKTGTSATGRNSHLRLIQDFLETNSNHISEQHLSSDFSASSSAEGISNGLDEILASSFLDNEEPNAVCLRSDAASLSSALSLCASTRDLQVGIQYHCLAVCTGFVANAYVGSSLITLYGKCRELDSAYKVFHEMPIRTVVSWTAIIYGFAQEWQVDVCLELFSVMRNSKLKPNDFTFTSLLSACTGSGALEQGRSAHCQIIRMGFDSYLHIANALVSMYCKCGSVPVALYIFENMCDKDIVSWNSMISGYAQHGLAVQAIQLFEKMKNLGIKPDSITFLGVLSSCRHAGYVEGGRNYFNSMVEYGVRPELDHYSCLVDLLGRAGLIEEAKDVISRMPLSPNAIIWGSLLSSCRLHGSVWIGIQAAERRLLLEPDCTATHVQLANLYASVSCWDQAARVRKLMKDRGLKTNPGYSWIEVKNKVWRFRAEDRSNARISEILSVLDCLVDHMITLGYVPEIHEEEVNDVLYNCN